jgi:serine/threonine-protein kinase
MGLLAELKRRNVYKVAVAYAVVGWLLVQIATQVFPFFEIPNWAVRLVVLIIAIGFPIALVLAWAFELTPEGLKRTEDVDLATGRVRPTGGLAAQTRTKSHAWIYIVIVGALLSVGLFMLSRYGFRNANSASAPATKDAGRITSLAVLPFKNYSSETNQEYFADGMTDLLTTELGGIGALTVKSHQSALKFKGSTKSMPEIGQELHADAILEGSVLRESNHVTVNVQLIEALTDRHLWAKKFEGDVTNIFKMRNEVVEAIAREVQVTISPEQSSRLSSARTANPAALQEYLLGRQFWNRQTEKGFAEALQHFNRAKEIDPGFALAWAGIADVYWAAADADISPAEARGKAKASAQRALELDDSLAEAHTALAAMNYALEFQWAESEKEIERAIKLKPNYALAHWQYGWLLVFVGRLDEARQEFQRAVELDPLSAVMTTDLNVPYTLKKDYDKAIAQCRKALELDSTFYLPHFVLGWIEIARGGNYSKALEEFRVAQSMETQPIIIAYLGYAYARNGERDKALEALEELNRLAGRRFVTPFCQALIYLGLRENSKAMDWLEKAYEGRSVWMCWLKVEPIYDPLRSDPRFQALYKKMNFPP